MDEYGTTVSLGTSAMREGHRKRLLKRLSGAASSSSPQLVLNADGYRSKEAATNSCICLSGHDANSSACQQAGHKEALVRAAEIELEMPYHPVFDRPPTPYPPSRSISLARRTRPKWPGALVDFTKLLPTELTLYILSYLDLEELVRCSAVNKRWKELCYDGQLWFDLDAGPFYTKIPAEQLLRIISLSGPFIKYLNLSGCVQLQNDFAPIASACKNLIAASLEGCLIEKLNIHRFISGNTHLVHLNLSRLTAVTNATCRHISESCKSMRTLNIAYCLNVDGRGLRKVLDGCKLLNDITTAECRGFDDPLTCEAFHNANNLRVLNLAGCDSLTDESVRIIVEGIEPEIDPLTNRSIAPPRKYKCLDLSRCTELTDRALFHLADCVPDLEGLSLARVSNITDAGISKLISTVPRLSHLDLEECIAITDETLLEVVRSRCAKKLRHLQLSFCEGLSDTGLIALIKSCDRLRNIELDNTRTGDRFLGEAAKAVSLRRYIDDDHHSKQMIGLRLAVFDCVNVNWTGIKEVMLINAETLAHGSDGATSQIVQLKCFHEWQQTIDEITKRMLRGNIACATRMVTKWVDYMQMNEEPSTAGTRRRRRRARDANPQDDDLQGRRRRGRGTGCLLM